jgi:hypothetical protein
MTNVAGRHRQQAVVEYKNFQIGTILNKHMLVEEINNNETSRSWVVIVPKVVKLINEHFSHEPVSVDVDTPIRVDKNSGHSLLDGTPVRVQLDNPVGYVHGERLYGKFRAGDIRWENKIRHITRLYLRPGGVPMYQVDDVDQVAYTKNQLQVVQADENKPTNKSQKKFIIKKLLRRFKDKNKVMFEVLWDTGEKTNEPRSNLIKDVPDLVEAFESK